MHQQNKASEFRDKVLDRVESSMITAPAGGGGVAALGVRQWRRMGLPPVGAMGWKE